MSQAKRIKYGTIGITILIFISFIYIFPLRSTSGIIDTTANQCLLSGLKPTIKHYHLLLGQYGDYRLVSKHLTPATLDGCGQHAQFRLYL